MAGYLAKKLFEVTGRDVLILTPQSDVARGLMHDGFDDGDVLLLLQSERVLEQPCAREASSSLHARWSPAARAMGSP